MSKLSRLPGILLLTASGLFAASSLLSQDINENNFILYTKKQGLSINTVTAIAQDSVGYLWLATHYGLNRFNGTSFVQFHSDDDSNSLPAERILGLAWIDSHRLVAFGDGLHIVDTRSGESRNVFVPYQKEQYQYKFNWIISVMGNEAGEIFVLTRSGFYHFDKDYKLLYRFDYYSDAEVPTATFVFGQRLLSIDAQHFVIISSDGFYYYSSDKKLFRRMSESDCPMLTEFLVAKDKVIQFYQHKPGNFLVVKTYSDSAIYVDVKNKKRTAVHLPGVSAEKEFNFRSGLFAFNDTLLYFTGRVSGFYKIHISAGSGQIKFDPKKYFPSLFCRYLLRDRDQNLWIATNDGLIHEVDNRKWVEQICLPDSIRNLFPNSVIDDIAVVDGKIYVGCRGHGNMLVFDKNSGQFMRRIDFGHYWNNPENIYSIVAAGQNKLLIGSDGPLFLFNTVSGKIREIRMQKWDKNSNWISDLFEDRRKNVWIASGSIYEYEHENGEISVVPDPRKMLDRVEWTQRIHDDRDGNIWFAGHGLLRYNRALSRFDFLLDSFPFIKMPDRQINAFVGDDQNNLWLNPNNNGLICYNIDSKITKHFTRSNGLPENNVSSMVVIRDKLWLATFSGIACLDLHTYKITSFGPEDGFPDQPIPLGTKFFYDSSENRLYIGFNNTIARFDPDIIYKKTKTPDLFIESISTDDQKRNFPGNSFTTSWTNNDISLTIGSINFLTPSLERFAYRLTKNDSTAWQPLGTRNSFSISNLSAGYHRLQVKLLSSSNRWPERIKELDITILPPFWKQSWFIALAFVLTLLMIYLVLKWRTTMIRRKERAKTHIEQLKAEEYKNRFELEQISHYFSSSLAGKNNVEEVLWDISKNLIGRMNYEDCMIYLWNEEKTKMVQKASYGPKGNPKAISDKLFEVAPGEGIVGYVMKTKEPIIVPDCRRDSRYRVDDISRLSEICVPIVHEGELIGIIDSEHPEVNHFTERDIKILTTIATLISNKIKQIEYEESLLIKQREISFINQQLAEAQLSALQTQMNPHFIFNSLNSIKSMILEQEQLKASRYMSKFANMLRTTLNQSKQVFTTLNENMEHLENYLAMEKLRFEDSFTYRITADEELDKEETLIPTMMIQPLAENAIWHGLMPKKGRKKLTIHFSADEETISCTIEDNGIGIRESERLKQEKRPLHQSVGLNNIRNRIKILNEKYDTGCTLMIADLQELREARSGSRVTLSFKCISDKFCL